MAENENVQNPEAQQPQAQPEQDDQPVFQLQRCYLKDASLEMPHAPDILLTPQESAPQVDIQFVQPVAGGMAAYDLALPVEQVDMVFLTQPEDNSTRVRFDTIYNFIVTVTSGDQIDQFLIICARNGYGSVE